ncbi:MAG: bifunctional UDP-N-acetylglucosamine diphosphorylase/glucosamine-1-phosphate N-acetyltransferase GlmU [Actinomycetes bacterium]|nr:bifunctional UDP-N-acetylglucosamine diphosphorylase/glucosamine-1-phosphate N-acetyltransferase GlmU [Actinomycetes bacterium]
MPEDSVIALILAAGAGTRMKSAKPKVIHEVLGTPLIRLVVQSVIAAGCQRVLTIVGHEAQTVIEALPIGVQSVFQHDRTGTAKAVLTAREALKGEDGYLLVAYGDMPLLRPETLRLLVDVCKDKAMAVLTASVDNPSGYGRIERDALGAIVGIIEDKDATSEQLGIHEINTGIYCFALDGLWERLQRIGNDNAQSEYYLTDMVEVCRAEGAEVASLQLNDPTEAHGVNSRVQLAEVAALLQQRVNARWMAEGVTMLAPDLVWVSPDSELGSDVVIHPMTFVTQKSVVGDGVQLGPSTRLVNSTVGAGSVIEESKVVDSIIGKNCDVGPRSYLRPGTVLADHAKVGASVEIKKSVIGAGSKVPHLSYLGDTTVGPDVNVGAGTITCNYDGEHKYPTEIGAGAFIGSDTMLVAPVRVGAGATIGAGSVITDDVPDRALGLGRARQVNKEGWVAAKGEDGRTRSDDEYHNEQKGA